MEKNKLIHIKIGKNEFLFDLNFVEKIDNSYELFPIPFVDDHIKGLVYIMGEIWVVISIEDFIGEKGKETSLKNLLILLKEGENFIALLCDEIKGIHEEHIISKKTLEMGEKNLPLDSITKVYVIDEAPVYKIDLKKLIGELSRF